MSQRREERGARIEREGARRERRDEGSGVRSAGRAQADAEVGDDRGEREARGVVAGVVEDALDAAVEEDEVGVRAREEGLERLVADRALGRGVGVERERPPHAGLATATRHATTTRAEGLREGGVGRRSGGDGRERRDEPGDALDEADGACHVVRGSAGREERQHLLALVALARAEPLVEHEHPSGGRAGPCTRHRRRAETV